MTFKMVITCGNLTAGLIRLPCIVSKRKEFWKLPSKFTWLLLRHNSFIWKKAENFQVLGWKKLKCLFEVWWSVDKVSKVSWKLFARKAVTVSFAVNHLKKVLVCVCICTFFIGLLWTIEGKNGKWTSAKKSFAAVLLQWRVACQGKAA